MSTGNLSVVGTSPGGAAPGALAKLSGLHEWLSLENRRVKQWWSTRSGTDLHKIYMNQLQDTDGKFGAAGGPEERSRASENLVYIYV